MAKHLVHAVVTVDGVDLSPYISSVDLDDSAEEIDLTPFDAEYSSTGQGLKQAKIMLEAFQGFGAAEVDATMAPLYASGGTFLATVKATTAAISDENPIYSMTGRLATSYSPISGGVGDINALPITISDGVGAGITRGTV